MLGFEVAIIWVYISPELDENCLYLAAFQMLISMVFEWQFWKNTVFHPYPSHSVGILFAYSIHTLLVCERHGKGEGKTWERFGKSKGIKSEEAESENLNRA